MIGGIKYYVNLTLSYNYDEPCVGVSSMGSNLSLYVTDMLKTAEAHVASAKISGDGLQGVGLRKTLHKKLDDEGVEGLAVNNPHDGSIELTVTGQSAADTKASIEAVRKWVHSEYNKNAKVVPMENAALKRTYVHPGTASELSSYGREAYYRSKDHDPSVPDAFKYMDTEAALEYIRRRFRMAQTRTGLLTGMLPEIARRQIYSKEQMYENLLPGALIRDEAYGRRLLNRDIEQLSKASSYAPLLKLSAYSSLPAAPGQFVGKVRAKRTQDVWGLGGALTAAAGTALATKVGTGSNWKALRNGAIALFPGMFAGQVAQKYSQKKKERFLAASALAFAARR